MTKSDRDIIAAHIDDPAVIFTGGAQTSGSLVTDLASSKTAVDAILVALENEGIIAKS